MGSGCTFTACTVCKYQPEGELLWGNGTQKLYRFARREVAVCGRCRSVVSILISMHSRDVLDTLNLNADLDVLNQCPRCHSTDFTTLDLSGAREGKVTLPCPRCEQGVIETHGTMLWE